MSTLSGRIEQSVDNLSCEGKIAFQRVAEISAQLGLNCEQTLDYELKERKREVLELTGSSCENVFDRNLCHLSLEEEPATASAPVVRALLAARGIVILKPRTPTKSPVSNLIFIQAQEAEKAARAAFKEPKTIFGVVTGTNYGTVLENGI
ncbi:hypothetical protein AC578_7147 [Pseudocercospora eumusae]|uniref:Uncharacterized protein n=1 Tax=Pseudocercospora eumusae TaxID=321146 RepID=A0A139HX46_9PEZI|nr:hypothetical protein AC578_7147 [Pseudocercospora eumusae]